MRKAIMLSLLLLFSGFASLLQVLAQPRLPILGSGGTPATGGGSSPTYTAGSVVAVQVHGFGAGTVTFSSLNGGVNFPSGARVYVGVGQDQGSTSLTSPQIGGNAATLATGSQDSSTKCQFYYATMPSASADTFTFTNGGAVDRVGVAAAYATNVTAAPSAASNQTFGANSNPQTPSAGITVPAAGFGIAFVFGRSAAATTPGANALTWANTTSGSGDVTSLMLNPFAQAGLAHTATAGSWTPTVSDAGNFFNFASCMSTIAVGP